ncbi:MAG: Gfo/Idh/MocA family oxidoreductase [Ruminococcaceae bacterium]|nr:Gfo/Idh/MocA family oxidoreductase [Oscillospiraceae bacterium]
MSNLKFAIYGCGVIAKTHAKALSEVEGAELYGCADYAPAAAETFAQNYGIKFYSDLDALLSSDEIDAVCICTPSGTHAPLAVKALMAGKNVVLEKPMAITVSGCDEIILAAEKSGSKIMIISQMRTSSDIKRAKEIIESGRLGKIILAELNMCYYRGDDYYRGSWRGTKAMDGGGALMNQGIHGVDVIQHLVGSVKSIQSVVRTLAHDIEVEDTAVAALEFECGALGVITASTATHPGFDREIKVYGTRGAVEIKDGSFTRIVIDGVDEPCEAFVSVGGASSNMLIDYKGHVRQITDFVKAINGEPAVYLNEHEGKKAVEIIETIYKKTL